MKRGTKQFLSFSIILILSISLISALSLGDILKSIFPFPGFTGKATSSTGCTDSDGQNNFLDAGNVVYDGLTYFDYCSGDVNYDYNCEGTPGQEAEGLIDVSLPLLKPTITGFAVGDEPHKNYINCMTSYQVPCTETPQGGVCGCVEGSTQTCGPEEGNTGACSLGTATCNDGTYGLCIGAIYPETEICSNSIDEDCDGFPIEGSRSDSCTDSDCEGETCASGKICQSGVCTTAQQCTPGSIDSCTTGLLGVCSQGTNTCLPDGSGFSSCIQTTQSSTELCTDDKDNDCDGTTDCDDNDCASACQSCTPTTCVALGYECGTALDGCGGKLNCGTCHTAGETCESNQCVAQVICIDSDGDGYNVTGGSCGTADCNDSNANVKPGASETCNNVDDDCDGSVDDGVQVQICGPTDVSLSTNSICQKGTQTCSAGVFDTCSGAVFPVTEILDNDLDDDCDGSVDEGGACTDGETKDCSSGCDTKEQTCEDSVWGDCTLISTNPDCDQETICDAGDLDTCGSNIGICVVGLTTCQDDGTWGDCEGETAPITEICGDQIDNDCDGTEDENCESTEEEPSAPLGTENPDEEQTTQEDSSKDKSFFEKLWDIIASIFKVGRSIMGYTVEGPTKLCADSDGGKNYFQKGTGSGLNQNEEEIWVSDFCHTGSQNDIVEKCGGAECYLKENYCDGKYVRSEVAAVCQYGCSNGACIPDASLSDSCKKFNKETWEWENIC